METVLQMILEAERGWESGTTFPDVRSFEAAGVLTSNRGLIVTAEDGSEFQIQIVRSK